VTHFNAAVCVPPGPISLDDAICELLGPYDMARCDGNNPIGEWDRYMLEQSLPVRPEHLSDPLVVHAPLAANDPPPGRGCAAAPKRLLDLSALYELGPTVALVTLDGRWVDEYAMGPEPDIPAYHRFWREYIDQLDPDAIIASLLIHC
jgi:hypothetical protein